MEQDLQDETNVGEGRQCYLPVTDTGSISSTLRTVEESAWQMTVRGLEMTHAKAFQNLTRSTKC